MSAPPDVQHVTEVEYINDLDGSRWTAWCRCCWWSADAGDELGARVAGRQHHRFMETGNDTPASAAEVAAVRAELRERDARKLAEVMDPVAFECTPLVRRRAAATVMAGRALDAGWRAAAVE